nr:unnamed protein product [Callosobruchus chinensis]
MQQNADLVIEEVVRKVAEISGVSRPSVYNIIKEYKNVIIHYQIQNLIPKENKLRKQSTISTGLQSEEIYTIISLEINYQPLKKF